LIGKGIGFGKKKGDVLQNNCMIEQKFEAINDGEENYTNLLNSVDEEIVAVCEEIIGLAVKEIGSELNPHIHIGLIDHINFAIHRLKTNLEIENPFLFEIQTLYAKEFRIAERAVNMLHERLSLRLPESEVGFIALHIHSASINQPVGQSLQDAMFVKEIVDYIQNEINVSISQNSLDYIRLISHLKYSINRINNDEALNNILLPTVKRKLKEEFKVAKKICNYISGKLNKKIPEDEVGYIALHINRLKNTLKG
jgi:transcriptional antiterminator